VDRIDAEHWRIPKDITRRGMPMTSAAAARRSKTEKQIHPLRLMKIMPDARGKSSHL
jgi:hypothetical protein